RPGSSSWWGPGRARRLRSRDAAARFEDDRPEPVAVQRLGAAERLGDAAAASEGAIGLGAATGALAAVAAGRSPRAVSGTGVASATRLGAKPAERVRSRGRLRAQGGGSARATARLAPDQRGAPAVDYRQFGRYPQYDHTPGDHHAWTADARDAPAGRDL